MLLRGFNDRTSVRLFRPEKCQELPKEPRGPVPSVGWRYHGMSTFPQRSTDSFGFREVGYEKRGWTARIAVTRPDAYNAYSTSSLQELATAFQDASWDDRVAVVVLTGAGDRSFCTGGDVKEYQK